mgnify:FL=1|jgi:hypothetical protein
MLRFRTEKAMTTHTIEFYKASLTLLADGKRLKG